MKLDSRLLERADEDGYQIDHQAVDQRDEYALNAAGPEHLILSDNTEIPVSKTFRKNLMPA